MADVSITYAAGGGTPVQCNVVVSSPGAGEEIAGLSNPYPVRTGSWVFRFLFDTSTMVSDPYSGSGNYPTNLDAMKAFAHSYMDLLESYDYDGNGQNDDLHYSSMGGRTTKAANPNVNETSELRDFIDDLVDESGLGSTIDKLAQLIEWSYPGSGWYSTEWSSFIQIADANKNWVFFLCDDISTNPDILTYVNNIKAGLKWSGGYLQEDTAEAAAEVNFVVFSLTGHASHAALASPGMYYDLSAL